MTASREVELKLELEPVSVRRIRRRGFAALGSGEPRTRQLASTYYDTEHSTLRRRRISFRVRHDGERHVQTVKVDDGAGAFDRIEYETELATGAPEVSAITDPELRHLLDEAGALAPVFDARFNRTVWRLTRGASEIEISLDEGRVAGAEREAPIAELELELLRGERADLFDVAREIARAEPVRLGMRSKAERGYALLDGDAPMSFKAQAVRLDRHLDAAAAFQRVARSCLRQFRLNEPGLVGQRAPEALHQARVAMRRLRSAFALFGPVIAGQDGDTLKAQLRAISTSLGEARNLDVYLARTLRPDAERRPDESGLAALVAHAGGERERAYDRVVRRLNSKRFRLFTLDLAAWIESGSWLTAEGDAAREPVLDYAEDMLDRLWRKVRKKGRHLDRLTPEARHRVRIQAKKLRYASEFFASLYADFGKPRRRYKAFVGALERLQASLGDLNDIATGETLAATLVEQADGAASRPLVFAAGHVAGEQEGRTDALLAQAAAAHRELTDAKPFWG